MSQDHGLKNRTEQDHEQNHHHQKKILNQLEYLIGDSSKIRDVFLETRQDQRLLQEAKR